MNQKKEYADLVGASPSKHSASEMCEDQIIVTMMKWLSFGYVGMGIYILHVTEGGKSTKRSSEITMYNE